jgi:hypothetical protein
LKSLQVSSNFFWTPPLHYIYDPSWWLHFLHLRDQQLKIKVAIFTNCFYLSNSKIRQWFDLILNKYLVIPLIAWSKQNDLHEEKLTVKKSVISSLPNSSFSIAFMASSANKLLPKLTVVFQRHFLAYISLNRRGIQNLAVMGFALIRIIVF